METNYHMSVLVHEQAKKYGDREMLIYQDFGGKEWKSLSWNQVSQTVKQISNALLNLGVKVQENIGIFSQNSVQYIECDFAAWGIRAVTIPFYATSSEQQIQFMVNDAKVRFLFVGEQDQYDKARRIFTLCPTLERIIVFDPQVHISTHDPNAVYFSDFLKLGENLPRQIEVEKLQQEASFDDIANILYTSGTILISPPLYNSKSNFFSFISHTKALLSLPPLINLLSSILSKHHTIDLCPSNVIKDSFEFIFHIFILLS